MGKFDLKDILNERSKVNDMQSTENIKTDGVIELIDLYKMIPSAENFYDTENIMDLVQSIKLVGVIQPLALTESEEEEDMFDMTAGHRRRAACKYLVEHEGKEQFRYIPSIVKPKRENLVDRLALIMANRFRDKTDWEKMQEIITTEMLLNELVGNKKLDKTARETLKELCRIESDKELRMRDFLAQILNTSPAQIGRYKAVYNNLNDELMSLFQKGKLSISVASEAAGLSQKGQERAAIQYRNSIGLSIKDVQKIKQEEEAAKPIQGQMTTEMFESESPKKEIMHFTDGEMTSDNAYGWYRHKVVHEYLKTKYADKTDQQVTVYVMGSPKLIERFENVTVFGDTDGTQEFDVENSRLEREYQNMLSYEAEQAKEIEEPRPVYKDVPCYSCLHYADCDKKSAAVSECDKYTNKAEAEKTEEQRYSEEQDKIDRETKKKMQELAEQKFEKLPPVEQERSNEPKVITLSIRQFAELEYKERNFLLVTQQDYRKDDKLILKELVRGQESGKTLTATVGYVMQERTGIEDKYCILELKHISGGFYNRVRTEE